MDSIGQTHRTALELLSFRCVCPEEETGIMGGDILES